MKIEPAQGVTRSEAERRQATEELPAQVAQRASASRSVNVEVEGKRVYFQVVDQGTGEVVRKVPPEEVRRIARNVERLLDEQNPDSGHVVDVDS
jgi:uncharacterized FlaG/YvyC family protein